MQVELEEKANVTHWCKEMNYSPSQLCLTGDQKGLLASASWCAQYERLLGAGAVEHIRQPWGLIHQSGPSL